VTACTRSAALGAASTCLACLSRCSVDLVHGEEAPGSVGNFCRRAAEDPAFDVGPQRPHSLPAGAAGV
jgi:hypothetical protein